MGVYACLGLMWVLAHTFQSHTLTPSSLANMAIPYPPPPPAQVLLAMLTWASSPSSCCVGSVHPFPLVHRLRSHTPTPFFLLCCLPPPPHPQKTHAQVLLAMLTWASSP
jgi:hypothetical protein